MECFCAMLFLCYICWVSDGVCVKEGSVFGLYGKIWKIGMSTCYMYLSVCLDFVSPSGRYSV